MASDQPSFAGDTRELQRGLVETAKSEAWELLATGDLDKAENAALMAADLLIPLAGRYIKFSKEGE